MQDAPRQRMKSSIGIGGASLLMILTILALTAFAVLSLSTSTAQLRLANKSAIYLTEYYDADSTAEILRYQIAQGLRDCQDLANDPQLYQDFWQDYLDGVSYDPEEELLLGEVFLKANQVLNFTLAINPMNASQRIVSWQVVVHDEGDYNTPFDVWQGQ